MAASFSNAFGGCNQLVDILGGLESRAEPAGEKPPKAIKRKHARAGKGKAKAAGKAKPAAKANAAEAPAAKPAAKPSAKAMAQAKAAPGVEGAEAGPAEGGEAMVAVGAAKDLKDTRKCVISRAYHHAKKLAKTAGRTGAEQLAAAKHAYKVAGDTWDQEHA